MLPYMLITLPRLLILRISMHFSRKRKGLQTNLTHEIGLVTFILYLAGLASQTIIPKIVISAGKVHIIGGEIRRVNLLPLNKVAEVRQIVVSEGILSYFLIEVLGNIVLFSIVGFMLPLLWRRFENYKLTVLACFLISLVIEVVQLVLPRATDIDDLILNTLGGVIGCLVYILVKKKLPQAVSGFKY